METLNRVKFDYKLAWFQRLIDHGRRPARRCAPCRRLGADRLPARARRVDGGDDRHRPAERELGDVQREFGMVEGFDVVLEMSGHPAALRNAIANMAHGGRLAQLGIPTGEITLDVNTIVFNQLTLRGIYGREMYETWYQMGVLIQSGLDIRPVITHRFGFRDFEAAFAAARSGNSGKVIMDWGA